MQAIDPRRRRPAGRARPMTSLVKSVRPGQQARRPASSHKLAAAAGEREREREMRGSELLALALTRTYVRRDAARVTRPAECLVLSR
jgi:hypothetical protein